MRRHIKAFKTFSTRSGPFERPSSQRHRAVRRNLRSSLRCGRAPMGRTKTSHANELRWRLVMQADTMHPSFDVMSLLTRQDTRCTVSTYEENQIVYSQGDPADLVFYVHSGRVKVTVISELGKAAIVAIRGPDEFCGEAALTGKPLAIGVQSLRECRHARSCGWTKRPYWACSIGNRTLPIIFSATFRPGPPELKPTWSTSCLIPARCGGAGSSPVGQLWRRPWHGTGADKGEPGDTRRSDRNDAVSREFIHEQISEAGLDRLQRQT